MKAYIFLFFNSNISFFAQGGSPDVYLTFNHSSTLFIYFVMFRNFLWSLNITWSSKYSKYISIVFPMATLPSGTSGKEPACQCRRCKRLRFDFWVEKIHWSRKWQPSPLFLPGKFRGQRSMGNYSQWGRKELDTNEWLSKAHAYTNISFFLKRLRLNISLKE